jgi:hypothetical protein
MGSCARAGKSGGPTRSERLARRHPCTSRSSATAVRMTRAGAPFALIARQLGHRDVAMVAKVYGRFKPDTEERDRWEHIAAARDEKAHEETPGSDYAHEGSDDSRGGTRTRDPGIMSAVL